MESHELNHFHKLYGKKQRRMTYQKKDFFDYLIMSCICAAIIYFVYGEIPIILYAGIALCVIMVVDFVVRHGVQFNVPLILRRPQDILYLAIYKIQNAKLAYFLAIGVLLIENYIIFLTPDLPHMVDLTREIGFYLFFGHLIVITVYRTVILVTHLNKRKHVKEVLMESAWRSQLKRQPKVTLEILHAYFTGVLTHIVYMAPWYLVLTYFNFSILLLIFTSLAALFIQQKWIKAINDWFYRDHWLGHNSEFEFVYLHGPHHDAIPCGLIGVAGNGYLEGFFRGVIAFPIPFYNPMMAAILYTIDVKVDIDSHQYIPGVFPMLPKEVHAVAQHSNHHYGRLEPYSFAVKLDQPNVSENTQKRFKFFSDELKNSIEVDEKLNGYEWNNRTHRWFLELIDKYSETDGSLTKDK